MKRLLALFCVMITVLAVGIPVNVSAADFRDSVEFDCGGSGFTVTVYFNRAFSITPGGRISILMLSPGPPGFVDTAEIIYADAHMVKSNEQTCSFFYDGVPPGGGLCPVKVTWTDGFAVETAEFTAAFISEEIILEMLREFRETSAGDYGDIYSYYVDNAILNVRDIPELSNASFAAGLGNSFVLVREGLKSGVLSGAFQTISRVAELKTLLKASVLAEYLQTGTAAQITAARDRYSDTLPKLIPAELSTERFLSAYVPRRHGNAQQLLAAISRACALALIKNGTYANVAQALELYAKELDVDLAAIKSAGLSLAAVAKEIDTSLPASYQDGLKDEIADIIKRLTAKQGGGGGISSGGSGGGGFGQPNMQIPITQPQTENNVNITTGENQAVEGFCDMAGFEWALEAVNALRALDVVRGVDEESFEPSRPVTRAEFIKLLVVGFKIEADTENFRTFADCNREDWFYPYVQNAAAFGIIEGHGDYFLPGDNIKREDAALISTRICRKFGFIPKAFEKVEFSDEEEISDYAKDGTAYVAGIGLFKGKADGKFAPNDSLTRAEAAVLVYRAMRLFGTEGI